MMRFELDPPPGFQGLSPQKPVHIYRRNLPHWRQDGATYFVTFRLEDAISPQVRRDLRRLKAGVENPEENDPAWKQYVRRLENSLDENYGSCLLREPPHQEVVRGALQFFDAQPTAKDQEPRYELGSYVVMPNHVHVIVRPLDPVTHPLEKILQSWKGFATREINRMAGRSGALWYQESFDRIIRDAEHLYRCVQYIGRNPRKANLDETVCPRWIRPQWREFGWDFVD